MLRIILGTAMLFATAAAQAGGVVWTCELYEWINDHDGSHIRWELGECRARISGPILGPTGEFQMTGNESGAGKGSFAGSSSQKGCDNKAAEDELKMTTSKPVVIPTGQKILPELDFVTAGDVLPLSIGRSYYSRNNENGIFGRRWSSSLDYGLIFHSGSGSCSAISHLASGCVINPAATTAITVKRPGGGSIKFTKTTSGTWEGPDESHVLTSLANGGWTFWRQATGVVETYSSLGQVSSTRTEQGIGWNFQYSPGGLLSAVSHTSGGAINFAWSNGRVSQITVPGGGIYSYTYSGQGYLQSVTTPTGTGQVQKTYHYEVSGKPWLLTGYSLNGVRVGRYSYNSDEKVSQSGVEGGLDSSTFTYGAGFTRVTNALGQQKTYRFGEDGRAERIERPASAACAAGATDIGYDAASRVSTTIDAAGNRTREFYSALGNVVQRNVGETAAGGTAGSLVTRYDWNAAETKIVGVREYSENISAASFLRETQFSYYPPNDPSGRAGYLSGVTVYDRSPSAAPSRSVGYTYSFHANKQVYKRWEDGPLSGTGDTTTYEYSSSGMLVKITNPLNQSVTFTGHNALGYPGRMTDPNGLATDFTYTPTGLLQTVVVKAPGGDRLTRYEYDTQGRIIKVIDPSGRETEYMRDLLGSITQMISVAAHPYGPDGKDIRNLTYNNLGQMISSVTRQSYLQMQIIGYEGGEPITDYVRVSDEFHRAQWTYDAGGFLSSALGNNGQNVRYGYNSNSLLASVTDSTNNVTTRSYDTHGRISSVVAPNQGILSFQYNPLGWLTKITDRIGNVTEYKYNGHGDLIQVTSPDSGITAYAYDSAGRVSSMTRADGTVTTYVRDVLGRVTTESATWASYNGIATPQVHTFSYDSCAMGKGRMCSFSDPSGSTSYTYYQSGELASQTSVIAAVSFGLSFAYDSVGRLSTATYPNGVVLRYSYSPNHQVERIEAYVGGVWRDVIRGAVYQPFGGPLVGLGYGNGLNRIHGYDLDGRLTRVYGSGTTHPQNLTYTYNANDQVIGVANSKNATSSQSYGYNSMGELTSADSSATGLHTWQYDATGNRRSHTWGGGTDTYTLANGSNRLSSISGARARSATHDPNGNVRHESRNGVTVERRYNGFNRLVKLIRPAAQNVPQPNGTSLNLEAGSWDYGVNAIGQRTYKLHVNSGATTRFLFSPGSQLLGETNPGSNSLDTVYVWLDGQPVGLIRYGAVFAVHSDHLGRPEVVTNAAKAVVWRARNLAFDRAVTSDLIGGLSLGFPGQQWDAEAGTWYNVFRDYDASTGRYQEGDPVGLHGGINAYAYVSGDPVGMIDPLGLEGFGSWTYAPGQRSGANPCEQDAMLKMTADVAINISLISIIEAFANLALDTTINPYGWGEGDKQQAAVVGTAASGLFHAQGYWDTTRISPDHARYQDLLSRPNSGLGPRNAASTAKKLANSSNAMRSASRMRAIGGPGVGALGAVVGGMQELGECQCEN